MNTKNEDLLHSPFVGEEGFPSSWIFVWIYAPSLALGLEGFAAKETEGVVAIGMKDDATGSTNRTSASRMVTLNRILTSRLNTAIDLTKEMPERFGISLLSNLNCHVYASLQNLFRRVKIVLSFIIGSCHHPQLLTSGLKRNSG